MPLEIIIHLAIGALSWLVASRFLPNKTINVLIAVIVGQLAYALLHYPIAVNSARTLQQDLGIGRYAILIPIRVLIGFVSAFILFKLKIISGKPCEEDQKKFSLSSIKVKNIFVCKSLLFTRLGILVGIASSLFAVMFFRNFDRAMRKLDIAFFSNNSSNSIKVDYFWDGLFNLLFTTITPAVVGYLFVIHVLYGVLNWLRSGHQADIQSTSKEETYIQTPDDRP
ncbi:MAG: hypothetical protein ACK5BE_06075 [Alphaproteobacteria bacterium]|jgi:hypothetical protein